MIPDTDILLAVSTVVTGLSLAAALAGGSDKVFPTFALALLSVGVGVFVYAFTSIPEPVGWREVPNAFISVVARILN